MSFFNELKKTIGNAADYTVKKTGEVTGTAKLRMDIRQKNTELAKCYEKIGRAYYKAQKNAEDHTDEMNAAVLEADTIKAEIAEMKIELAKLQGCTICPVCSAQISDKSVFCPQCGVKLPEKEEPAEPAEEAECACESKCECGEDAAEQECDCKKDGE